MFESAASRTRFPPRTAVRHSSCLGKLFALVVNSQYDIDLHFVVTAGMPQIRAHCSQNISTSTRSTYLLPLKEHVSLVSEHLSSSLALSRQRSKEDGWVRCQVLTAANDHISSTTTSSTARLYHKTVFTNVELRRRQTRASLSWGNRSRSLHFSLHMSALHLTGSNTIEYTSITWRLIRTDYHD